MECDQQEKYVSRGAFWFQDLKVHYRIDLLFTFSADVDGEYIRPNQTGCWRTVKSWEEDVIDVRKYIINYFKNNKVRQIYPN